MYQPKIDVKIVNGHFCRVLAPVPPRPEDATWHPVYHRPNLRPHEDVHGMIEYARTKEDQSA
jgi:hypothetical protein